jgi:hypothetical protein
MFRGYVSDAVWKILAEVSYFYRQLCAKEIRRDVMEQLEKEAPMLFCKLEKIFSPGFFNPMQHLFIHLPYEAKVGGPVQGVFGLAFGFGFCPLKAKSQPKGWIQEAAFSKSRLSRSANLKAPLDLLLVAF